MIYLDYGATTPVRKEVLEAMLPYFSDKFGNPGSMHQKGLEVKNALDQARHKVAEIINCKADEVIFTSSGTESINMAIKAVARAVKARGKHIITSAVEHHAVLDSVNYMKEEGFDVTILPVDREGLVDPQELRKAIRDDTILISIMYANNEIGSINDIRELAKIAKEKSILFHTDACQAASYCDITVDNIDMLTLDGGKIYGPKGVGILYIKEGTPMKKFLHGGSQENNRRAGTENVPYIVGFAKALELTQLDRKKEIMRLEHLRDKLIQGILQTIPDSFLNGHPTQRLPNNVNITILNVEGESVLLKLNEVGICASTGSACNSKTLEASHVITALNLPYEAAHGAIRLTLGKQTTEQEINKVLEVLPSIVEDLRKISPTNIKKEDMGR